MVKLGLVHVLLLCNVNAYYCRLFGEKYSIYSGSNLKALVSWPEFGTQEVVLAAGSAGKIQVVNCNCKFMCFKMTYLGILFKFSTIHDCYGV